MKLIEGPKPPTRPKKPPAGKSRLRLDLADGELVTIGNATVRILAKSGRRTSIEIEAGRGEEITAEVVRKAIDGVISE